MEIQNTDKRKVQIDSDDSSIQDSQSLSDHLDSNAKTPNHNFLNKSIHSIKQKFLIIGN
jgi:hypothetical protein